jgi:hypothetical protein
LFVGELEGFFVGAPVFGCSVVGEKKPVFGLVVGGSVASCRGGVVGGVSVSGGLGGGGGFEEGWLVSYNGSLPDGSLSGGLFGFDTLLLAEDEEVMPHC